MVSVVLLQCQHQQMIEKNAFKFSYELNFFLSILKYSLSFFYLIEWILSKMVFYFSQLHCNIAESLLTQKAQGNSIIKRRYKTIFQIIMKILSGFLFDINS